MPFHLNLDENVEFGRSLRDTATFTQPEPKPSAAGKILIGSILAATVFGCAFIATPVRAAGSMAPEVRIVHVTPEQRAAANLRSIRKEQVARSKEQIKEQAKMDREVYKAETKRQIEADKAYYKRLAADRKSKAK